MTKYVKCRFCGNFEPLLSNEPPSFTVKENGKEEAVCPVCFAAIVRYFKKPE